MINRFYLTLLFLCFHLMAYTEKDQQVNYKLTNDPIDVVIVTHPKDKRTLDYCIDGITQNCSQVRRVIVVSSEKLTDKAEWFDEKKFPFNKETITKAIGKGSKKRAEHFFSNTSRGAGWYFQQLLKLYSSFVIPNISSNVLVLDSDTIFMNPVSFLNEKNGGLFCIRRNYEGKKAYFKHAKRLVPGYKRIYPEVYSVCHHMLFQKTILQDLFNKIEKHHKKSFWVAFCNCVDLKGKKGASEYEIYYNHALRHTNQVGIRELLWANSGFMNQMKSYKEAGYSFVSFHTYLEGKKK